jgi:hypothetical protein
MLKITFAYLCLFFLAPALLLVLSPVLLFFSTILTPLVKYSWGRRVYGFLVGFVQTLLTLLSGKYILKWFGLPMSVWAVVIISVVCVGTSIMRIRASEMEMQQFEINGLFGDVMAVATGSYLFL